MKRVFVSIVAAALTASLALAGCGQAAPPPTPTKAPAAPTKAAEPTKPVAAPTKAAEPTKAPAPQPTAVPAKKVDFPEKGKTINMIVPYAAGGGTDVGARLLAAGMEKELGVPVQVVNRAGASSQVGITELAKSKPDGYTIGFANLPQALPIYLDPERKAVFGRKDILPMVLHVLDQGAVGVSADGPYKTMKDVIDAAKASPEKVKVATTGILSIAHLAALQLQQMTGVKFAIVHFDGGAPAQTSLLGGHTDLLPATISDSLPQTKAGKLRVIGIMDKQENPLTPGVKTLESQGYPLYYASARIVIAPTGVPKEIVDILTGAATRTMATADHKSKLLEQSLTPGQMNAAQLEAYWNEYEKRVQDLLPLSKE